jgi:hypothetical protein
MDAETFAFELGRRFECAARSCTPVLDSAHQLFSPSDFPLSASFVEVLSASFCDATPWQPESVIKKAAVAAATVAHVRFLRKRGLERIPLTLAPPRSR